MTCGPFPHPRSHGRNPEAAASRRSRSILSKVTASTGSPNPTPARVLTSHTTRQSPSLATRSTSPCSHLQLRARTSIPEPWRTRSASSSPKPPRSCRVVVIPRAAQHCALLAHPICSLVDSPTTESFGVDKPTSGNVHRDTHEAATAPSGYPRELPWEHDRLCGGRRRTPTLDQVARYASVSRATVSRVVNGSTSVDPALRKIVDEAVADLNYVPNLAARALMTRRTDTIALVAAEGDRRVFGDPSSLRSSE